MKLFFIAMVTGAFITLVWISQNPAPKRSVSNKIHNYLSNPPAFFISRYHPVLLRPVTSVPSVHKTSMPVSFEALLRTSPISDGFDFPVGPPDAKGYYNAQPFGRNHHLGEDWNGVRGGNSDLGDAIHSVANGVVTFVADIQNGWGYVIRIAHNVGSNAHPVYLDSLYAHFDAVAVAEGDIVQRGQFIGTMGNCDGLYAAHLHFEMRSDIYLPIGRAYGVDRTGYIHPTAYIQQHRPKIP